MHFRKCHLNRKKGLKDPKENNKDIMDFPWLSSITKSRLRMRYTFVEEPRYTHAVIGSSKLNNCQQTFLMQFQYVLNQHHFDLKKKIKKRLLYQQKYNKL